MWVGILGPLAIAADDGTAVAVSVDALAAALWEDDLPADRANAVQSLVSRLRRAVPGLTVVSGPAGYRLDLSLDDVDARRFERLTAAGREALRTGDPRTAYERLCDALALWRGPALTDVADAPFAAAPAARLVELRLTAVEDRIEAELLTAAHPLRERLAALRLRALAAAAALGRGPRRLRGDLIGLVYRSETPVGVQSESVLQAGEAVGLTSPDGFSR